MSETHPRPWRIERSKEWNEEVIIIRDANGEGVLGNETYYPWVPDAEYLELIVRCVNKCADEKAEGE